MVIIDRRVDHVRRRRLAVDYVTATPDHVSTPLGNSDSSSHAVVMAYCTTGSRRSVQNASSLSSAYVKSISCPPSSRSSLTTTEHHTAAITDFRIYLSTTMDGDHPNAARP